MKIIKSVIAVLFCIILLFTTFSNAIIISSSKESEKFYLWAMSDTHGMDYWDDEVSYDGVEWSGNLISEDVERIDYAFIAGDVLFAGGHHSHFSSYLNDTCSCIMPNRDMTDFWNVPANQRIWGFCMGNHEEMLYNCNEAAKGLGLDSGMNWYNNEVFMGHSYNYSVLRGNLLFIFMGGNRDNPEEYSYNLPTPGDFYWLEDQVQWADENNVNVVIVTHSQIYNSSNSFCLPSTYNNHDVYYDVQDNVWKNCTEHTNRYCDFDDPWPGNSRWEECDDYWNLIEDYQNVNLWFNGHTHTNAGFLNPPPHEHAGWDTTLGVERDIQKSPYCTFVNLVAIYAFGFPWSNSRVLIFSDDSSDVKFKCFDHQEHSYGHDTGWMSSSQDIIITECLKYPFNPDYEPNMLLADANGPYFGEIGQNIEISADATGGMPIYSFDWDLDDDGAFDDATGQTITWSWTADGIYPVNLRVTDQNNDFAYDAGQVIIGNAPPNSPEKPTGPSSGEMGTKYEYQSKTDDVDGDDIFYLFSWGDSTTTDWLGPFKSGDVCKTSHVWDGNGAYVIKVKARDELGLESAWSEPLPVIMPRNRGLPVFHILKFFEKLLLNWIQFF